MMDVYYTVHGGPGEVIDVLQGLVRRNERTLRDNPAYTLAMLDHLGDDAPGVWRDIPAALASGVASVGTRAAWEAAHLRVSGTASQARVALFSGVPITVTPTEVGGFKPYADTRVAFRQDGDYGAHRGRILLTIDDDQALAVREIGDEIAKHNARRIKTLGLPKLYESGVRYRTEHSPEQWLDAEAILAQGNDDCEGLAAYRAGELINAGYDARVHTRAISAPEHFVGGRKGGRLFHALVAVHGLRIDGGVVYDDPSRRLGMPVPKWYTDLAARKRAEGGDLG